MAGAGKIEVKIIGDASSLKRAFSESSAAATGFGKSMLKLAGAAGVAFAAFKGVQFFEGAVKSAVDFEKAMRNVNSIAKLGDKQFKQLGDSVLGMAQEVGQKPKLLAEGLYDIVSSGFKAADATKILKVGAFAATAGMTDAATATKAVTAALNAYHLPATSARKVSDILFQTVNKGVLTFEELSQQMGDLVPAAAPLGVSLEEVGAAMATVTLQGVPAAEAATRVKNTMLQLAKPSAALKGLLREQGYESGEAAVKARGFAGVLELLSQSTKGSVTETAKLTPEIRSLLGVVGLTGENLKTYEANLRSMDEAQKGAGITAEVYAEQSKSVAVMWQQVSAGIDVLKVQIGTALLPALKSGLDGVSGFLQKFNEAHGAGEKFRVVTETITSAARETGEMLLRAFRSIDWNEVGRTLADGARRAFDFLVTSIRNINWGELGRTIGDFAVKQVNRLTDFMRSVDWNAVGREMVTGFGKAIKALGQFLLGVDWGSVMGAAFNNMVAFVKGFGNLLLGIGTEAGGKLLNGMRTGAVAMWTILKVWLANLPGVITSLFFGAGSWLLSAGKEAIMGFLRGAQGVFGYVLGQIQSMVSRLKAAAASVLTLGQGGGGGGRSDVGPGKDFASIGKRSTQAIEKGTESIVQVLKRRTQEVLREVNYLQGQIDKVNARREREDLASAVRNAQATLAQTRADKKATQMQIEDAERGLARAQEDIRIAARNHELTAAQAHYDKVKAQLEKANQAMLDKQQAAADAFQKVLDKARQRAATSFDRLSSLIQRGFDAVTDAWVAPSQKAIDAITNRRANEDLAQGVKDAQERLAEAIEGGDPGEILEAQRQLARAKEDIVVASLQRQADAETTAHDKTVASQQDALDRMLTNLQTSFTNTGTETDKGMASVLKIINGYLGGFKGAGTTLGSGFASALRTAIENALDDANELANTKSRTISPMPAITAPFRVPGLATGGQILRTGLALVHRGETVMPAKQNGGGSTVNVTVHGFVGNDQDIAGRIVDTINREQRVGRLRFAT